MSDSDLTQKRLKELLHYDLRSGVFYWRKQTSNRRASTIAGSVRSRKYRQIGVDGRLYYAHRLAFFYVLGRWPTLFVDHADRDRENNAWANLREANGTQNSGNAKLSAHNVSGFKGVSWCNTNRKWRASIAINRKATHIGLFHTTEAAALAYDKAARDHFGGAFASTNENLGLLTAIRGESNDG